MSISNNGPPLDDSRAETIVRIRSAIAHLEQRAEHAVEGRVGAIIRPTVFTGRWFPSRLVKCPRDREWLAGLTARFLIEERAKRQPQIDRLRRKLRRLGADET